MVFERPVTDFCTAFSALAGRFRQYYFHLTSGLAASKVAGQNHHHHPSQP